MSSHAEKLFESLLVPLRNDRKELCCVCCWVLLLWALAVPMVILASFSRTASICLAATFALCVIPSYGVLSLRLATASSLVLRRWFGKTAVHAAWAMICFSVAGAVVFAADVALNDGGRWFRVVHAGGIHEGCSVSDLPNIEREAWLFFCTDGHLAEARVRRETTVSCEGSARCHLALTVGPVYSSVPATPPPASPRSWSTSGLLVAVAVAMDLCDMPGDGGAPCRPPELMPWRCADGRGRGGLCGSTSRFLQESEHGDKVIWLARSLVGNDTVPVVDFTEGPDERIAQMQTHLVVGLAFLAVGSPLFCPLAFWSAAKLRGGPSARALQEYSLPPSDPVKPTGIGLADC
mmetsp:Transcript_10059/g.30078  ORF Transcript_10059/g.30078 Transcript_10059/m.30078 type:complete len:349 (-) Transcript_10059:31-1077(-)